MTPALAVACVDDVIPSPAAVAGIDRGRPGPLVAVIDVDERATKGVVRSHLRMAARPGVCGPDASIGDGPASVPSRCQAGTGRMTEFPNVSSDKERGGSRRSPRLSPVHQRAKNRQLVTQDV